MKGEERREKRGMRNNRGGRGGESGREVRGKGNGGDTILSKIKRLILAIPQ